MAVEINNSSDIGITCGLCSATFTGQARYSEQVMEMFVDHYKNLHPVEDN